MTRFRLPTLAVVITLAGLTTAGAASEPALTSPRPRQLGNLDAAFERLKTLVGTWDEEDEEHGRVVEYHLTGRGSTLIEEFVGDPPMASLYHMDGPDLRLTHHCNAGNQPRMRAASYDPDTGTLAFEFVDVTNLSAPGAYHTRELTIRFIDDDHVVLNFVGRKNGEPVPGAHGSADPRAACRGRRWGRGVGPCLLLCESVPTPPSLAGTCAKGRSPRGSASPST